MQGRPSGRDDLGLLPPLPRRKISNTIRKILNFAVFMILVQWAHESKLSCPLFGVKERALTMTATDRHCSMPIPAPQAGTRLRLASSASDFAKATSDKTPWQVVSARALSLSLD